MKMRLPYLAASILMAACSSSPEIRYYTLSADSGSPRDTPAQTRANRGPYAIDAVSIPDLLDRPQIVLRSGANAVEVLDYDRWAAPLADQLQRVFATELSARLGPDAIIDPGLPSNSHADRRISISILEFDPERHGESALAASWSISGIKSSATPIDGRIFRARHVATSGTDMNEVVGTMSGLVMAIADDIAATIDASE
jgi:uncharacterized protein